MMTRRRMSLYKSQPGCCGCCTNWNAAEEDAAQHLIKEKAIKTVCGKLLCCGWDCWYRRYHIRCSYILMGLIVTICIIATTSYSSDVYWPAVYMDKFKKADCKVDMIIWDKNTTAECEWKMNGNKRMRHQEQYYDYYGRRRTRTYYSRHSNQGSGWRIYKCLQIYVNYTTTAKINRTIQSVLLVDEYKHLKSRSFKITTTCTTHPETCKRIGDLEEGGRRLERYYRTVIKDRSFSCIYNPYNTDEVTLPSDHNLLLAYQNMIILITIMVSLIMMMFSMCNVCGCRYTCANSIPTEVTEEVNRRHAENAGGMIANRGNGQFGSNVFYVGQNMGPRSPRMIPPRPIPMTPHYGQYPPPRPPGTLPGYYAATQQQNYLGGNPYPPFPPPRQYPLQGQYPPQGLYPPQGQYPPSPSTHSSVMDQQQRPSNQFPPAEQYPPQPDARAPLVDQQHQTSNQFPPGEQLPTNNTIQPPLPVQSTTPTGYQPPPPAYQPVGSRPPPYAGMNAPPNKES